MRQLMFIFLILLQLFSFVLLFLNFSLSRIVNGLVVGVEDLIYLLGYFCLEIFIKTTGIIE